MLHDVDFGASRFVAVGEGLSGDVLTSLDGDHWERVPTVMPEPVHGLVWAGDSFYACASNEIFRSGDGLQWHVRGHRAACDQEPSLRSGAGRSRLDGTTADLVRRYAGVDQ